MQAARRDLWRAVLLRDGDRARPHLCCRDRHLRRLVRGEKVFVTDHVAEIKAYWSQVYPWGKIVFSSHATDFVPANAPPGATLCIQYSMTGTAETVMHIEG